MDAPTQLQHLLQLPAEERVALAEALLESVDAERVNEPIPPWVHDELRARWARFEADPSTAIPWSEVRDRLRKT